FTLNVRKCSCRILLATGHVPTLRHLKSHDLTMDMTISTQIVIGILGNFSLLCSYIILHFMGYRLRSTDLILKHLTVANSLVLSKRVPHTMAVFGWKNILSDFGCKLLFFLHRMGRGVSTGSIYLLSVFQVIMIIPWNSRWAALKATAPKYMNTGVGCHCLLRLDPANTGKCHFSYIYITGEWSDRSITKKIDSGYCSSIVTVKTREALSAALLFGSMVLILYRHKQQVQHIRGNNPFPRSFPESGDTKTILLLVSTFVYFYIISSIFQLVVAPFDYLSCFLVNKILIIAACFHTVSAFLLMSCDSSVHRPYIAWIRNKKIPYIYLIYVNCMCFHSAQLRNLSFLHFQCPMRIFEVEPR
ncbi:hypothetical protein FD754_023410, partial [Muntiacus muntjak]